MDILIKNRGYLLIPLVSIVFILIFYFFINDNKTSMSEPEIVLTDYLESVKNMDVDKMTSYVIDKRYQDKATMLEAYKKYVGEAKLLTYKIESVKFTDNQNAIIETTLEVERQIVGKRQTKADFNLVQQNGEWKVFFESRN